MMMAVKKPVTSMLLSLSEGREDLARRRAGRNTSAGARPGHGAADAARSV
jgi:hypothetical protein